MYKKSILILGAGFGGLRAALHIDKKLRKYALQDAYRVVLIDRNDYHTYAPTLYEIATTAKDVANFCELKKIVTFPVADIIRGSQIEFIKAEVSHIDMSASDVHLAGGAVINFDYILFALGSEVNYFGITGLEQYAFTLKSFTDAVKIRERISAEASNPERGLFRIVIGGGGSTGVELASEIQTWLCSIGKNSAKVCWATITIIEGMSSILSNFSPHVIKLAQERIDAIGAVRIAKDKIESVTADAIKLASGSSLSYDMFIWTGGVKQNHLMSDIARQLLHKDERLYIDETMRCMMGDPTLRIAGSAYAIGDAACFIDQKTQRPVPMVARVALSQAKIAAHNIIQEILKKEEVIEKILPKKYIVHDYPYVIPVGGKFAIARFGSVVISGFFGWMLKGVIELNYLLSIMPKHRAILLWLKGLKIFIQNNRLG